MASISDTEAKSPASNGTAPTPREKQPSVERQPLPKPKKETEQDLINSVARYQAELEQRERREREQAAAASHNHHARSNGTNGRHHPDEKPPKVDTPLEQ